MFENLSMYEAVKQSAKETPNSLAIYYKGKRISYSSFIKRVDKTADIFYYKLGIRQNDVVLVSLPNIPDVIIVLYALNKIGAIANLVHPFTPFNKIKSIIKETNSKLAIMFEQRIAKEVDKYRELSDMIYVCRIEDDLPFISKIIYHLFMNKDIRKKLGRYQGKFNGFKYFKDLKTASYNHVEEVKNKNDDVSILLHSGSTTGEPKTICLTDNNFNWISSHGDEALSIDHKKIKAKGMLAVLPSFHGFGLCMTMHTVLSNSLASILIPKFSPKEVVKAMKQTPVGIICGVPTMYETLIKSNEFNKCKQIKNLHVCWSGGDLMMEETRRKFNNLMKEKGSHCQVFEGYGLTEAVAVNCLNTFIHNKDGSIGYPLTGADFKIFKEDGSVAKANEIGEIAFRSGAVMKHYLNNIEASNNAIRDGYLYTGDLGYIDEDGFIFFSQRKKRVVKVSGVGVFPSEVEKLISTIHGVHDVCAISIPDKKLQHSIKVFVVATFYDEEGMRNTIMETCQKYLIRWSVPKEIEFVNTIPKTLLGKSDFVKLEKEELAKRGIINEA